jgi:hypothetical protein
MSASVPAERLAATIEIEPKGLGVVPGPVWAFRIRADGSAEAMPRSSA